MKPTSGVAAPSWDGHFVRIVKIKSAGENITLVTHRRYCHSTTQHGQLLLYRMFCVWTRSSSHHVCVHRPPHQHVHTNRCTCVHANNHQSINQSWILPCNAMQHNATNNNNTNDSASHYTTTPTVPVIIFWCSIRTTHACIEPIHPSLALALALAAPSLGHHAHHQNYQHSSVHTHPRHHISRKYNMALLSTYPPPPIIKVSLLLLLLLLLHRHQLPQKLWLQQYHWAHSHTTP